MSGIDFGMLIQSVLLIAIQVLLPVALTAASAWLFAKFQQVKQQITTEQYLFAETLVRQFVQAAEQAGIVGMLVDTGEEKKTMVIAMAEAELAKHGINLDLDVIDALVESIVYETFGWEKKLEE